jgi:hypothetical protein
VVGTDRPPSSHEALRLAVRRAALTGAVLDTTIARRAQSGYDGCERQQVVKSPLARVVMDVAGGAGLLVIGGHRK